jgi:hypothetical protein
LARKLRLKHHHPAVTKAHFADGKIEFPHTAKPIITDLSKLLTIGQESISPMAQGLRIMEPENFKIGDPKPRAFNRGRPPKVREYIHLEKCAS